MQILVKGCYYSAWEFLGGGYSCWQLMFSINHTSVTPIISVLLGLANICMSAYMGCCPLKYYLFSFNMSPACSSHVRCSCYFSDSLMFT